AYGLALLAAWRRPATRAALAAVVVPAVLFSALGASALPTQSGDIVDYLLSGRIAAVHGASPYQVAPEAFPDDPLLPFASGDYTADAEQKPPIWIGAAVGVSAVAGDQPATAVHVFRLVLAGFSMANLLLLWVVLRRRRPEHLLAGLLLYGWNPVVTTHGQAKLDVVMATFALLGAWALLSGRRQGAVAALWCSVMVKLLTLPLLAVLVLGELRARRWRSVATSAVVVVGLTLLLYAPFDGGARHVVEHLLLTERGGQQLPAAVSLLFVATACVVVVWAGLSSRGDPERVLQGWALAALAVVLLIPPGWSWYLITPVAVVALSGERWRTLGLFGLSGLVFALDTWTRSKSDQFPLPEPAAVSRSVLYAAVVVAAVLALAVGALLRSRGRARG
ncbi:MAG: hypothetical protein WB798_12970, partial [Nocardioidaceae bacterium]